MTTNASKLGSLARSLQSDGTLPVPTASTVGAVKAGTNIQIDPAGTISASSYTLPIATASVLGGVKQGSNVTIAADGTLSASAAPYTLPVATASVLGGVKQGSNTTIAADGTLSVAAPLTPASSVTTVAATSAVGTSTNYARQDHTHDGVTSISVNGGAAQKGAVSITTGSGSSSLVTLTDYDSRYWVPNEGRINTITAAATGTSRITSDGTFSPPPVAGDIVNLRLTGDGYTSADASFVATVLADPPPDSFGFNINRDFSGSASILSGSLVWIQGAFDEATNETSMAGLRFDTTTNKWHPMSTVESAYRVSWSTSLYPVDSVKTKELTIGYYADFSASFDRFKAASGTYGTRNYTLPSAIGTAGQVLGITGNPTSTNATLTWQTVSGGGGGGGTGWTAPANIAIGDICLGTSLTDVLPGATKYFSNLPGPLQAAYVTVPTGSGLAASNADGSVIVRPKGSSSILRSTDNGTTWTSVSVADSTSITNVVFGRGIFLGVDTTFGGTSSIYSSTDGLTWTARSLNVLKDWGVPVVLGNNWVITQRAGAGQFYTNTSTDGLTWTLFGTTSSPIGAYGAVRASAQNLAVFVSGGNTYWTTTDGSSWTERTAPAGANFTRIASSGSLLLAMQNATSTNQYYTSTDGINWTQRTFPNTAVYGSGVVYGDGVFFVATDTESAALFSTDGINWTSATTPSLNNWGTLIAQSGLRMVISSGSNFGVRFSAQNDSLYLYSSLGADEYVSAAPAGTYRCLGGTASLNTDDALWVRTA